MSCFQNRIVKGRGNPVALEFFFDGEFKAAGLNNFTRIVVEVGGETYDTDSASVDIHSATELRVRIGGSTSLATGEYKLTITGYSATYTLGYELTSDEVCPIASVIVV